MGKGQVFIIIAIIVIVVLVSIRTSLNLANILENKRFLELGLERQEFQNLKGEVTRVIQVSYNQSNISNNLHHFMSFAKESLASRATIMTGVGLTADYPNVTQNEAIPVNVTFINYLDEDVSSINLTFNNTQQSFTSVGRSSVLTTNFTFRTGENINFSLVMNLTASSINITQNVTIPVEIGKARFVGFFDLKISSNRLEQRDKFTETVVLNATSRV